MLSIQDKAIVYGQDLDNLGGAKCWEVLLDGNTVQELDVMDSRFDSKINRIEQLHKIGRHWNKNDSGVMYKVRLGGECLMEITPETLDISGRMAPIAVIFNLYRISPEALEQVLTVITGRMNRALSAETSSELKRLKHLLALHSIVLFFHLLFFSRK